ETAYTEGILLNTEFIVFGYNHPIADVRKKMRENQPLTNEKLRKYEQFGILIPEEQQIQKSDSDIIACIITSFAQLHRNGYQELRYDPSPETPPSILSIPDRTSSSH
ncbi:MAG TPA: hypothetical protein VLF89_07330, partial [Candidatus Saccharimonadales bacterium]|nr:hypothetical protein [Candidatus Saccharimonadales bacterium]